MALTEDDIKAEVKTFIISTFLMNNPAFSIQDDDSFMEKGIVDSTGVLEVINFIQNEFGFEVLDSEILPENIDSIKNISSYVLKKKLDKN